MAKAKFTVTYEQLSNFFGCQVTSVALSKVDKKPALEVTCDHSEGLEVLDKNGKPKKNAPPTELTLELTNTDEGLRALKRSWKWTVVKDEE